MSDEITITPTPIPPGRRRAIQASTTLLHEWAATQPWVAGPWYELRLGPTRMFSPYAQLTPQIEAMLRRSNWYADLVGVTATEVQVIEAKVVITPAAIGQLEHYVALVPGTEALRPYASRHVVPVLLVGVDDDVIHQMAVNKGIRVIVSSPSWLQEYLLSRYFRRRQLNRADLNNEPEE